MQRDKEASDVRLFRDGGTDDDEHEVGGDD